MTDSNALPACVINCAVYDRHGKRHDITLDAISDALAEEDNSFVWVGLYEPEDTLLDIGAGIGTLAIPLSFLVRSVTTIDHADVLARLKARALRTGMSAGPGRPLTPQSIRSLRERLRMPRIAFAKLVGVSPGSIFGWETGRTLPRGRSAARLREVRKMGLRRARNAAGPARRGKGRKARRR